MTSTRRSRLRGLRDRLSGDGGFALVEVMVSAVLLIVLATATLNIIDQSSRTSASTKMRATATGLAQEDQDGMRAMSVSQLDQRDTTYTRLVDNIRFSIRSTAQWVRDTGDVACDASTDRPEYLKTTSYVTWPGHTSNPVTLESYVAPGVEALAKGALMVKLHTDPGVGVPGVTVRLSNGLTALTDNTGCALFTGLDAGTLAVSWDGTSGDYVDRNGIQTPSESVVIGAGQTAQVDRLWDRAGSALVRWIDENRQAIVPDTPQTTPGGGIGAAFVNSLITRPTYTTPATALQTRFFDNQTDAVALNTTLDPHIVPVTQAGVTTKVTELFPFAQSYTLFAGGCTANIPPATIPATTYTNPSVRIPAGGTSTQVDVLVPTTNITLQGVPATAARTDTGGSVTAIKLVNSSSDPFCVDSRTIAATSNARTDTVIPVHMPLGTYRICIQKSNNGTNYAVTQAVTTTGATTTSTTQAGVQNATVRVDGIGSGSGTNQWKSGTTC
jgi:Tfp pilus assembly protein PilV